MPTSWSASSGLAALCYNSFFPHASYSCAYALEYLKLRTLRKRSQHLDDMLFLYYGLSSFKTLFFSFGHYRSLGLLPRNLRDFLFRYSRKNSPYTRCLVSAVCRSVALLHAYHIQALFVETLMYSI
jgi:hypothetical protein